MKARPSKGTISGRVWAIADSLSRPGVPAFRAEVVAAAVKEKIDPKTASTQFGAWKRTNHPELDGITRRRGHDAIGGTTDTIASGQGGAKATSVPPVPALPGPDRHWASLLKNGFVYGADWQSDGNGGIRLDRAAPSDPGVYVFVEEDQVVHVGTTRRMLADRMRDYRIGHAGQLTSARIKAALVSAMAGGKVLRVLFAAPGMTDWNGLPVEIAAGLEAGLLARFQPGWNRKGLA